MSGCPLIALGGGAVDESDQSVQFLLRALALSRQTGAPPLACLAGVRRLSSEHEPVTLGLTPVPGASSAVAGVLELAMLADLALGASGRARVGVEEQLPTVSLSVQLTGRLPAVDELLIRAHEPAVADGQPICTSGVLLAGTHPIGHCSAVFASGGRRRLPPLPWERSGHRPSELIGDADQDSDERAVIEVIRRNPGDPAASALLTAACFDTPAPGSPVIELRPTRLMANRGGTVQGGALFALATQSAMKVVAGSWLSSGYIQFLAAADIEAPVVAGSEVLRAGRRTAFVRTDLRQGDSVVASASFVLLSIA